MTDRNLYNPRTVIDHADFKKLSGKPEHTDANIALCYSPEKKVYMVQKPRFDPAPGQVECHVKATGFCGSDVHFAQHGAIGPMVVDDICGCGHESAGEVTRVGEGVTDFQPGDRVAIEAGVPCGVCDYCKRGRYNACPDVVFFSTPPHHGTMTRYHLHPAAWLHKLPESMSFEEGALCEPLAVAMAGMQRSGMRLGDCVVVCGAGPIGLVTLLAARAAGAIPLITDLSSSRLDFAKKLVPSVKTVLIEKGQSPKEVAEKIQKVASMPVTLAMECTGVESSIHAAIFSMAFGGKVFIIGVGKDIQTIPFMHLSANEIDLQWQFRYANQYPRAIRCVANGMIDVKPLVTHRFCLEDAMDGFETAANPASGAIKVQIVD
ncbi:hypothetical protein E3P92_00089 [Wallemia ichthyophaga]|uniref:L-arabinitol 4-dehydrogenase n=2 Tax=Wallemia ichthyophaga TaxID=245174 RepID=A0A4T0HS39_WALIC|nr:Sorbitol dehydrogenase [Wallemia ichthyophaga EXF-994]TIA76257.1 hypothetical protein E3P91_00090 [Wallemia ichthyophaga]EOR04149.1 Sorbitol dehydrogenase [Wallemia ichthyophaga EXF-994]TIA84269.1 hypothetical protein E3P98_00208 [Wallemia ichthyophaga]TIA94481.1 hypothetical protein E3P97_00090 [Wallemia ichthyophaga]TIB04844.1 hypothetical protein E3P95_00090 [Wallemia ichthyophaga]